MNETLEALRRRWKNACKVVFKQEVGELEEYLPWLDGLNKPKMFNRSSVSGKDVTYAITEYADGSKWISLDEVDFSKKFEPLDINEIKDIDSLLQAISERVCYVGDVVLGNSGNVEKSSNISDSFYIYDTTIMRDSKYLCSCSVGRDCEDSFGTYGPGESAFCVRCTQTYRLKRCFELWQSQNCNDCYYSFGLNNCSDCIFCFNAKSRRRNIGNLELEAGKYSQIKGKLLLEMAGELKKTKKLQSLLDIVARCKNPKPSKHATKQSSEKLDKGPIEVKFSKTAELLLGRKLENMDEYSKWLERHTDKIQERTSIISGKKLMMVPSMIAIPELPKDRVISSEEAEELGNTTKLSLSEVESLTLANSHERIGPLAYFNVEFREGTNINLVDSATAIDSSNCYRTSGIVFSKYCGYTFWPKSTEQAFGCHIIFDSNSCINCYHSTKLTRCFEMDSCRNCSDSMFCHNCENLRDCMFCFNIKSKRYAIGNAEVGREEYMRIKRMVLEHVAKELKKKDLQLDIYNVGVKSIR